MERIRNRESLIPLLSAVFLRQPVRHWLARLQAAGIASGPINDLRQVFDDPQVRHRGLRQEAVGHGDERIPLVANPIRYEEQPLVPGDAPPRLGEHTDDVLASWPGLDAAALARLRADRVI